MREIGRGGYSSVWRPTSAREPHVIKKPRPGLQEARRQEVIRTYRHQKRLLDDLHAKVPQKSDLFNRIYRIRKDGSAVMSDLGGTNLTTILENRRFYGLHHREIMAIWQQLREGVLAMNSVGIAHRDIKDGNIMARRDIGTFRVAFIDFADSITKEEVADLKNFRNFGTKEYMSPELLERRCFNDTKKGSWDEYVANDLWALGIVLYRMLYNKHPFDTFRQKDPDFWSSYKTDRPQCADAVVGKLLLFYDEMRIYPEIYDKLFPPLPEKDILVGEARTLLSLDPRQRLTWLRDQQQQGPSRKRVRRSSQGGIEMLLQAASDIQKQEKKK